MSDCKYYDCGWCYAPDYLKTNAIQGGCFEPEYCPSQMSDLKFTSPSGETTIKVQDTGRLGTVAPKTQLHIKMDEPVQYETPMTENEEEIEKVKAQIKVLQKKLDFLEELEKTKTPCEEAYKEWWGEYPSNTWQCDVNRWDAFQAGYNAAYQEPEENEWKSAALKLGENLSDSGPDGYYEFSADEWFEWAIDECLTNEVKRLQEKEWNAVRESVKWCEEHPDKDPLDWLKPQNPEQTSQSLKEAFVEAQKTEKWKEIQKLIDEKDNDKNFKNSLDLIKEWGEKNKPPTLKELLWEWWEDIFTVDSDLDADASIDVLVDIIDKKFIPPSSERNTYDWERCLKRMREKLR